MRFDSKTSESTSIIYMTDGILLREALNDALLKKLAFAAPKYTMFLYYVSS